MIQRVDAGRELTQGAVGDLSATLSDQVARGVTGIHMSAEHVMTFDSGTLQALVEFDELAKSRGLTFTLVDPSELLYTALRITGLARRLEFARGDGSGPGGPVGGAAEGGSKPAVASVPAIESTPAAESNPTVAPVHAVATYGHEPSEENAESKDEEERA